MLILTAKQHEMIKIGDDVFIHIYREHRHTKVAIIAPKEIAIERKPLDTPFTNLEEYE